MAALHRLPSGMGEPEYPGGQFPDGLIVLGLLSQRQGRLQRDERRLGVAEDDQRVTGKHPRSDVIGPALHISGDLRPRLVGKPRFGWGPG